MVIFYKKWKKYNEIRLTKNKMDLNIRKMTNQIDKKQNGLKYSKNDKSSTLPEISSRIIQKNVPHIFLVLYNNK